MKNKKTHNSMHYEATKENYLISTNPVLIDINAVHQYLAEESYWAKGIPLATVEKSITHSLCFGLYENGKLIGFARLVTDRTTFAYLCDVFILPAHQGKGLGKWLMQTIHSHPDLQGLRRWMLATRDAHGLYAQFGWTPFDEELGKRFMQLHNPHVYSQ